MATIEPSRFERLPSFLLAGIRRHHTFSNASSTIPEQWREFRLLGKLPSQISTTCYGAVCSATADSFEYLSGVAVSDWSSLPKEIGRMRVPEQEYAVFVHQGHVSALRFTWEAVCQSWLPNSGLTPANTPSFELCDSRFDPATGTGEIEIWFPIDRKPEA